MYTELKLKNSTANDISEIFEDDSVSSLIQLLSEAGYAEGRGVPGLNRIYVDFTARPRTHAGVPGAPVKEKKLSYKGLVNYCIEERAFKCLDYLVDKCGINLNIADITGEFPLEKAIALQYSGRRRETFFSGGVVGTYDTSERNDFSSFITTSEHGESKEERYTAREAFDGRALVGLIRTFIAKGAVLIPRAADTIYESLSKTEKDNLKDLLVPKIDLGAVFLEIERNNPKGIYPINPNVKLANALFSGRINEAEKLISRGADFATAIVSTKVPAKMRGDEFCRMLKKFPWMSPITSKVTLTVLDDEPIVEIDYFSEVSVHLASRESTGFTSKEIRSFAEYIASIFELYPDGLSGVNKYTPKQAFDSLLTNIEEGNLDIYKFKIYLGVVLSSRRNWDFHQHNFESYQGCISTGREQGLANELIICLKTEVDNTVKSYAKSSKCRLSLSSLLSDGEMTAPSSPTPASTSSD
jgi:hypothetical protein